MNKDADEYDCAECGRHIISVGFHPRPFCADDPRIALAQFLGEPQDSVVNGAEIGGFGVCHEFLIA